jgi:hypothetical protein
MRTLTHWAMESVHSMGVLVIYYVSVLLSKCQILNCIVLESNPGPPDRMWMLYHWAMESVHIMGVLVSWPPGRGQLKCNYSTPPPTSKHTYTIVVGGRGSPGNHPPPPIPAHIQLLGEPSNRQQHTTTVDNSTLIHKITNVPLFKKLWDIIFFWWDNHFMSQKKNYIPQFLKQPNINS